MTLRHACNRLIPSSFRREMKTADGRLTPLFFREHCTVWSLPKTKCDYGSKSSQPMPSKTYNPPSNFLRDLKVSCFHDDTTRNERESLENHIGKSPRSETETSKTETLNHEEDKGTNQQCFLHIGPSGDCWTGPSLFAAKHLQPDYVKSFPIENHPDSNHILEMLQDNPQMAQKMYDTEEWPYETW